jgi:hypothetical protein
MLKGGGDGLDAFICHVMPSYKHLLNLGVIRRVNCRTKREKHQQKAEEKSNNSSVFLYMCMYTSTVMENVSYFLKKANHFPCVQVTTGFLH